jgi:hypothetical protein
MSRYIQVVGDDDDDVSGSVMGDVMGWQRMDGAGMEVVGYDEYGDPVVGRAPARRAVAVRKPGWRKTQMAPGVIAPDQGLLPLPLTGSGGTNTFTATLQTITFQGVLQKPFRGERLLVSTSRTGTSATGRLIGQLFVGTDLQQVDVQGFDIEQVGSPQAFGVRLTMKPAQPGVWIRLVTTIQGTALVSTDTIFTSVTLLGRLVH